MKALLGEVPQFWRRHTQAWESQTEFQQAFSHLLLMSILQRLFKGKGRIEREYAAGCGRGDGTILWVGQVYVVEIKLVHPCEGYQMTLEKGLEQINRYADRLGATHRTLDLFDRRAERTSMPWGERLRRETYGKVLVVHLLIRFIWAISST